MKVKLFFEYVHSYINTFKDAAKLMGFEIVDNPDDADLRFVASHTYKNYKKPYVIISHGIDFCDQVRTDNLGSQEKLNVIIKTNRDVDRLKDCDVNFIKFYGRYHNEFNDVIEKESIGDCINSYINKYDIFPDNYEHFNFLKHRLQKNNIQVNLFGWGNGDASVETFQDTMEMINSKFTLHMKEGYLCEAVRRSIICGTPVIMKIESRMKNEIFNNYKEIYKNGIVFFDTDEQVENYILNITDEEYKKLRKETWIEGERHKKYDPADIQRLKEWIFKIVNIDTVRTIPEWDHSLVGTEALIHDGCIVDVGCIGWEWSEYFIGKKRVIGIDPFADEHEGFTLFKGLIGPFEGTAKINNNGVESSTFNIKNSADYSLHGSEEFPVMSWKYFCKQFGIDKVSVLKINIEGGEYALLNTLDEDDYAKIDQIAVSFHDWINPKWKKLTQSALHLLQSHGYSVSKIYDDYGWYLARKKI